MNISDKPNFAKLLTALAELHNRKLSQQLLDIYWHALKSFDYKDVMQSLNRLIIDPDVGQFMPKPADIVRNITGDSETRAILAWSKVMQAIRQFGAYESIEFDDKKIHSVITDMGGWIALCRKTTKELEFLSREFEKHYRACQHLNVESHPVRVIGKLEQINSYQYGNLNIQAKYIGTPNNTPSLNKLDV